MKSMVVGCLLFMLFAVPAGAAVENLVELHKHAGNLTKKECLACHASILKETSLDKKFKTLHRVHFESKKATPKNCADCHYSVDLQNGSAAALRKQVDPHICSGCHSGSVKSAKILYAE